VETSLESRKPPLEPALRAEAARAERALSTHPSPETLAAYHERRLAAAEQERLRDHLALCTNCAQLLLDLFAFAELGTPAEVHGPTDVDRDSAWRSLRVRLGDGGEVGDREIPAAPASGVPGVSNVARLPQPPQASPVPSRPRPSPWAWALAASLLAVAGLGFWVFELRQENARLTEPAVNAVIADLATGGDATRGGGEPKEQPLPADRPLVLILNAPDVPVSAAGYEVQILADGPGGPVVRTLRNLPRGTDNNFTLDLPPGFLRPGKYQIRLYSADTVHQPLADFPLRIGAP
jgi:hypothetical protein